MTCFVSEERPDYSHLNAVSLQTAQICHAQFSDRVHNICSCSYSFYYTHPRLTDGLVP